MRNDIDAERHHLARRRSPGAPAGRHVAAAGRCLFAAALTAAAVALASPSAAQESRAEAIAWQQEDKRERLSPNLPTRTEKMLMWLENYGTSPSIVLVTAGGLYPSAGFAPGVAWHRAMGLAQLQVGGAWSVRNYKLARVALRFPELLGNRVETDVSARWLDATQVPFYGVGAGSHKGDLTRYGLRATEVGANATYKPVRWLGIGAGIAVERQTNRAGAGPTPSVETLHSSLTAPGLLGSPRYTRTTASAAVDWRESAGYTRSGGLYAVTVDDFSDRDDAHSFRRTTVDVRQFVPILKEQWVLAFRGLLQTTETSRGRTIPYYAKPSLGGNASLRAYPDFRFQDDHLLLLSAEYRWFPSRVLDLALFADAGQVVPHHRDFHRDRFETGYGIGARFHGPTFTPLRIDIARGREGIRINVTGSVAF